MKVGRGGLVGGGINMIQWPGKHPEGVVRLEANQRQNREMNKNY